MKLSKLKNIIRESLNDLIVEQDFIAGGPFLPLAYPTTTVDQGNDIAHVVIRDCSSELPVYSQPACLNNHSQYEIGHQFKFYDVLSVHVKKNDNKYIVYELSGIMDYINNIEE